MEIRNLKDIVKEYCVGDLSPVQLAKDLKDEYKFFKENKICEETFFETVRDTCVDNKVEVQNIDRTTKGLALFGKYFEVYLGLDNNKELRVKFSFNDSAKLILNNLSNAYIIKFIFSNYDVLQYPIEFYNSLYSLSKLENNKNVEFSGNTDECIAKDIILRTESLYIHLKYEKAPWNSLLSLTGTIPNLRTTANRDKVVKSTKTKTVYMYIIDEFKITNINHRLYSIGVLAKLAKGMKGNDEDLERIKTIEKRLSMYEISLLEERINKYSKEHRNFNIQIYKSGDVYKIELHGTTILKNPSNGTATVIAHERFIDKGLRCVDPFDTGNYIPYYKYNKCGKTTEFFLNKTSNEYVLNTDKLGNVVIIKHERISREKMYRTFMLPPVDSSRFKKNDISLESDYSILEAMSYSLTLEDTEVHYYRGVLLDFRHILTANEVENFILSSMFKDIDIPSLGKLPRDLLTNKMVFNIMNGLHHVISICNNDYRVLDKIISNYEFNSESLVKYIMYMVYIDNSTIEVNNRDISINYKLKKIYTEVAKDIYYNATADTIKDELVKGILSKAAHNTSIKEAFHFFLLTFLELDEINGRDYSVSVNASGDFELNVRGRKVTLKKNANLWINKNALKEINEKDAKRTV